MKNYIVVGYYTKNTVYETEARRLTKSLLKFGIPHCLEATEDLGGWYSNTNYKPYFLKKMLNAFPNKAIVYIDCDAEFLAYPALFDEFALNARVGVAVYVFDKTVEYKFSSGTEVLSGTVFLQNTKEVASVVDAWCSECSAQPLTWDQKSLEKVLGEFTVLPGEYCKIFDRMKDITNPVIVHHQASRKIQNKHVPLKRL